MTYSIAFNDGSELKWNSLVDKKQMDLARQTFEEKAPQPVKIHLVEDVQESDIDEQPKLETIISEAIEPRANYDESTYSCNIQ